MATPDSVPPSPEGFNPLIYRAVIVVTMSLSLVALLFAWSHWGQLEDRAWMMADTPDAQLEWIAYAKGLLRTILIMAGMYMGICILALIRPKLDRKKTIFLTLGGFVLGVLVIMWMVYMAYDHWTY